MCSGYLSLETHPNHAGVIRLFTSTALPQPPKGHDGGLIRYIARFSDVMTARMNIHEELHRRLLDVDYGSYRSDMLEAIAKIDALELRHSSVWIDPGLDETSLQCLKRLVEKMHLVHQQRDRRWQMVGAGAVGLLLFGLLIIM